MNTKMYSGILFIGDILASKSRPGRRVDEDFFETVFNKLKFTMNYAKENNLKPVVVGRLCRKKFEVTSYARLITELSGMDATVIASENEFIGASNTLNQHSQASLLEKGGIINLCSESGIADKLTISDGNNAKEFVLYGVPEKCLMPSDLSEVDGISNEEVIVIRNGKCFQSENEGTSIEVDSTPDALVDGYPGCSLFVSDGGPFNRGVTLGNGTQWLNTGPLVRSKPSEDGHEPLVWKFTLSGTESVKVPHEQYIFDTEGMFSKSEEKEYESSEFTMMLKQATTSSTQDMPENFISSEIAQIVSEREVKLEVREILNSLFDASLNPSLLTEQQY